MKHTLKKFFFASITFGISSLVWSADVLVRGGGGAGTQATPLERNIILGFVTLLIGGYFLKTWKKRKNYLDSVNNTIMESSLQDRIWEKNTIMNHVENVFFQFQKDWSDSTPLPMREYLTENYYRQIVLELNILQNEKRKNEVLNPKIHHITILEAHDDKDNTKDFFTAEIKARADDTLRDLETGKVLFSNQSSFTKYWKFVREGDTWKIETIDQIMPNIEPKNGLLMTEWYRKVIEIFTKKQGFYYDIDFGRLMIPNKGVIFKKTSFQNSNVENHVIGYFRKKVVEFYTYMPYGNGRETFKKVLINFFTQEIIFNGPGTNLLSPPLPPYKGGFFGFPFAFTVAQAVIPKSYFDILVRKKNKWWFNFGPWGLKKVSTESIAFDNRFCIWADPRDRVNSLELLTPNFMEKIYHLPFDLNIEVVGNFLYLYTKAQKEVDYDQMLEILSWAFDEMER
ncbi:MAG: TIM44-like domain-containing protein [Candidatus Peregrinibacteria bacterium]